MVLWGRSVLGRQKVPRKVPPRFFNFRGVSGADPSWAAQKVPPRFHQCCASFVVSMVFWARSVLGCQKEGSAKVPPRFPNSVSFRAFRHSKGLGAKWHVCLLGFFAANGFRLPKGSLECSPNSSLHWSHSLLQFFLANGCYFRKGSVEGSANYSLHLSPEWLLLHKSSLEGSANCALHFISQSPPGVKVAWVVDMSHSYKSSPQKTTHHVVAVGVFFGLFFLLDIVVGRSYITACEVHTTFFSNLVRGSWGLAYEICGVAGIFLQLRLQPTCSCFIKPWSCRWKSHAPCLTQTSTLWGMLS